MVMVFVLGVVGDGVFGVVNNGGKLLSRKWNLKVFRVFGELILKSL